MSASEPIQLAQADIGRAPRKTLQGRGNSNARDYIIVSGEKRTVPEANIVTFVDDRSWDFARLVHFDPNRNYTYPRKLKGKPLNSYLEVQEVVDMVAIHSDITYTARTCFNVLKARGFSTHFMIDWDGTIYQGTDTSRKAIHAASDYIKGVNNRSIGIDMNCMLSNFARGDKPATPKGPLISQFAHPDGKRRMSEVVEINGIPWKSWGYTDAQYDSLIKLLASLGKFYPKLKLAAPVDERGEIIWQVPADDAFDLEKIGLWGHMHLTAQKFDPGPGFDWSRVLQGLSKEHNRFPVQLVDGLTIPNLLTAKKVKKLAKRYFKNNESSESGGFYPLGLGGQWHGGIHLHAPVGTPVVAMFEGTVVAAHNGPPTTLGSNNFVLLRHEKPFDPRDEKRKFVFYSLYMHLLRFDQDKDRVKKKSKRAVVAADAAPDWVTDAKRVITGKDDEEGDSEEEAERLKYEKLEAKRRKDEGYDDEDEAREKREREEDEEEFEDDVREEFKPFLDVGNHLAALKRGDTALFDPGGKDQTRVAAGDEIGRVGLFGESDEMDDEDFAEDATKSGMPGVLHVEIFADGSWRQLVDLLGVHGEHWFELEADTDDNLTVDTDDLLRLIMPEEIGRKRPKLDDFIFTARQVLSDDIVDFYARDEGDDVRKEQVRRAITRHVSEWSDQVDWFKSMAKAQGWDERVEGLKALLQDEQGRWRKTLFARQIQRQLPFVWLNQKVAEHVGLETGTSWDGVLYFFHPIHFLLWLTFHTNTRLRVLAKGRSKKQLKRLRVKEQKLAEERRLRGEFPEDFDHASTFEIDDDSDVEDPRDVLRELWDAAPMQGEWDRYED